MTETERDLLLAVAESRINDIAAKANALGNADERRLAARRCDDLRTLAARVRSEAARNVVENGR